MIKKFYSFIILLLVVVTCKKEESVGPVSVGPVADDPTFRTYINRFVSEASSRGISVDVRNLKVIYSDTLNYYCGWGDPNARQVQISSRVSCWLQQTDMNREILLFHEMGHAILGRSHDNTKLPNGDYKSIMFGGTQFNLYTQDTPERRKYYLDELFNPATSLPSWGGAKTVATVLFADSINAASNSWKFIQRSSSSQTGVVTTEQYVSVGHSLKMISPNLSTFSYWGYSLAPPQDLKQGDRLVLSVKVRAIGLTTGSGAIVAMRGDATSYSVFFTTTQGITPIRGTSDFVEFQVALNYYVTATSVIYFFLMIDGNSVGTAYFDDVTLTKYE